jgi:hypothetical protein
MWKLWAVVAVVGVVVCGEIISCSVIAVIMVVTLLKVVMFVVGSVSCVCHLENYYDHSNEIRFVLILTNC